MTAAGHMRDMQGFMLHLRELLSQPANVHGGMSAYSPVRGRPGGQTYASELASQQRVFRQLEDSVAQEGGGAQGEGVPSSRFLDKDFVAHHFQG